jgi:hypothetical protein
VQPGDTVMSHANRPRRVLRAIRKSYSGDLVSFRAKGFSRDVTCTPDHRFVSYPGLTTAKRSRGVVPQSTWTPADRLDEGDRVLVPWGVAVEPDRYPVIDTLPLVRDAVLEEGDRVRVKGSGRTIRRYVAVDPTFCWLVGLYLAEGGISNGPTGKPCRVDLNLWSRDYFEAMNAVEAFRTAFGAEAEACRVPSKPNVMYVRCSNAALADVFHALMPGNLYSKAVPSVVFAAPRMARLACIRGWLDGDGFVSRGSSLKTGGVGSSPDLLHGMFRLAVSCRLRPKLHQRRRYAHQRVAAKSIDFYGASAISLYPEFADEVRESMSLNLRRIDVVEHGLALPVRDIRRTHVADGEVFCLEVEEDHSFVANGYAVHNCTSFGSGHTIDLLQCIEIFLGKQPFEYLETCTEAIYGMGREVGGMLGGGDGCYGIAVAKAIAEMGVVPREMVGEYSGQRAKQWGGRGGVPSDVKEKAKPFKGTQTATITTLAELDAALANLYPTAGGFSQGFSMHRNADGVCRSQGRWGHEEAIVARRTRNGRRQYLMLQSWGPNVPDGPLTDDQPDFSFWIDESDAADMLGQRDWVVFSGFGGFRKRPIPSVFKHSRMVA